MPSCGVISLSFSVLFVAILSINTLLNASQQPAPTPCSQAKSHSIQFKQDYIDNLASAIRIQTISSEDSRAQVIHPEKELLQFHKFLETTFPRVHSSLTKIVIGNYSLIYVWKAQSDALPILLMGHLDVVPIAPGTEGDWEVPPFAGQVKDGYLYGRGTIDDKHCIMGIMEALEQLLKESFVPTRSIYISFGHDEEVSGFKGAQHAAAYFKSQNLKFDFILDEGLTITYGLTPGIDQPVAMIGTEEKGAANIEIRADANGGHSSMPPPHTAIGILGKAITRMEENQIETKIHGGARSFLTLMAPEMKFPLNVLMSNMWIFEPAIVMFMKMKPTTNALISTTTSINMVSGGFKSNVVPTTAHAISNHRIAPYHTPEILMQHLTKVIDNPQITLKFSEPPFLASPVADHKHPSFQVVANAIRKVFPGVLVAPNVMLANTDTRWFWDLSSQIYRFSPTHMRTHEDIGRFHGTNERISIDDYVGAIDFFYHLVKDAASPATPKAEPKKREL